MISAVNKAVIPAAGLGTRFLPATKAMPKEMLPVVDKPAIQYVVEEAVAAELSHILMITGRNKNALENHFDRAIELENLLESKGDYNRLDSVNKATDLADIHYVRQGVAGGLGHAISKAKTFVAGEPFAVLLGDDLIDEQSNLLSQLISLASREKVSVVALTEVPKSEISKYGVATLGKQISDGVFEIKGFVEKPSAETAPSNLAVIGRYVLQPEIFDILRTTKPGLGGEIQLTDALATMASNPQLAGPVWGVVFTGKRYDTGNQLSYLQAIVEIASQRADLGEDFSTWLSEFVNRDIR